MKTCAYCGEEIKKDFCPFCKMKLDQNHILVDGKLRTQTIEYIPDESALYQSTAELINEKTLNLFFILKYARADRKEAWEFQTLAFKTNNIDLRQKAIKTYKEATQKQNVIENILLERVGFVPKRITNEFIDQWINLIECRGTAKKMA